MNDNFNTDSGQTGGIDESPNSSTSPNDAKPSSETVAIPKAKWDELERTIKRLENEDRSVKDRAVDKVSKRLDKFDEYLPVLERVANLVGEGLSQKDAINVVKAEAEANEDKLTMRDLRQFLSGAAKTTTSPGSGAARGGKVAEVAREFNLDENSPEVVDIYKRYGDSDDAEKAVLRLAAKRQHEPSASASTSIEGKPMQIPDQQAMISRLEQLQVNPSRHWKEIEELNKKLGWD